MMLKSTPIPTFCFMDESGTLNVNHESIRYFAVGAIIHSYPDDLVARLHREFEGLCGALQKEPTRLEFKFTFLTEKSLPYYLNCIDILSEDTGWRFCSLVINLDDEKFIAPSHAQGVWEHYLRYTKLMFQKNLYSQERAVLLADYLRKPKGNVHSLATLPAVVSQLVDTLQVHSQGVILVQMADILLGASLYKGKDVIKTQFVQKYNELFQKNKQRFNIWKMKWK